MLDFLERSTSNVLGIKATGRLTHTDYQQLVPKLEGLIQEHGKVRVLFELEDCQGWDLGAPWDDLKFSFKRRGDLERCTVVGERRWQKWMTKLSKPFFRVKYFDKSALEKAWQWVLEGADRWKEASSHEGATDKPA